MTARLVALLVCIVFSVPFPERAPADPAEVKGVFFLKVRNAPDFEAEETGVLRAGDVVDVIGEVGRWSNVALTNGTTGYVSRKYLSPVTAMAPPDEQPKEDAQKTDEADAAQRLGAVSAPERVGPSEGLPLPPEKPQVAVTRTDQPHARRPAVCTRADLQELKRELKQLAAAQDHLAKLMAAGASEEPVGRDWSSSISTRQMLFWLGAGCVLGWLGAVGFRHRRERRQRSRIRI